MGAREFLHGNYDENYQKYYSSDDPHVRGGTWGRTSETICK